MDKTKKGSSFGLIRFKSQKQINAERRKKLEDEREVLRKRVNKIWGKRN